MRASLWSPNADGPRYVAVSSPSPATCRPSGLHRVADARETPAWIDRCGDFRACRRRARAFLFTDDAGVRGRGGRFGMALRSFRARRRDAAEDLLRQPQRCVDPERCGSADAASLTRQRSRLRCRVT
jgi:hypothetical protein